MLIIAKNNHVEKVASGVMTKLKSQQSGLAIDAEIKSEMIVEFVVKLCIHSPIPGIQISRNCT